MLSLQLLQFGTVKVDVDADSKSREPRQCVVNARNLDVRSCLSFCIVERLTWSALSFIAWTAVSRNAFTELTASCYERLDVLLVRDLESLEVHGDTILHVPARLVSPFCRHCHREHKRHKTLPVSTGLLRYHESMVVRRNVFFAHLSQRHMCKGLRSYCHVWPATPTVVPGGLL